MASCKTYSASGPFSKNKVFLMKKITKGPLSEKRVYSTVEEEEMVSNLIQKTMPGLEVKDVQTVNNSFLEAMYSLKKEEYKSRYGRAPQEMLLFHVTAASNVDSIISNNFDWRRISRGKFGLGTSFSGDAAYANKYANLKIGGNRAIIVTSVLIVKRCEGYENMRMIPRNYDTSIGNYDLSDEEYKVYVKFSDNEMLPRFVVTFNKGSLESRSQIHDNIKWNRLPSTKHLQKSMIPRKKNPTVFNSENNKYSSSRRTHHLGFVSPQEHHLVAPISDNYTIPSRRTQVQYSRNQTRSILRKVWNNEELTFLERLCVFSVFLSARHSYWCAGFLLIFLNRFVVSFF